MQMYSNPLVFVFFAKKRDRQTLTQTATDRERQADRQTGLQRVRET